MVALPISHALEVIRICDEQGKKGAIGGDPGLLRSLARVILGTCYAKSKRYSHAKRILHDELPSLRAVLPDNHETLLSALFLYGKTLDQLGEVEQATQIFVEVIEIKILSNRLWKLDDHVDRLSDCLRRLPYEKRLLVLKEITPLCTAVYGESYDRVSVLRKLSKRQGGCSIM